MLGDPHVQALVKHEEAATYQEILNFVSSVFEKGKYLNDVLDTMIDNLECAEVQNIT